MSSYVEGLLSLLEAHPYLWLFPLAVVEGPLVAMVAGSMVSLGLISWPLAYPLVVAADLVGDTAFYILGCFGHRLWVLRALGRLGVKRSSLDRLEALFRKRGARVLVGGKLTHFAGAPVLAAAGLARVGYGRFLLWNLVATVPKTAALMAAGYLFGWQAVRYLDRGSALLLLISLAALAGLAAWKLSKRDRREESRQEGDK
jgi:membrane-associated protein